MLIDAHLDLAFNGALLGADLTQPLDALRESAFGREAAARRETPTVSLPALREAGVRVVFGTIFVLRSVPNYSVNGPHYTTPEEAAAQGWAQIRYYQQLAAQGHLKLIGDCAGLAAALDGATTAPGLVPLMEGADPIRDPDDLGRWYEAGLRLLGLSWCATRYAGGTGMPGPLTDEGRALLRAMRAYPLGLDTSHMAEESFWQALEIYDGPVMASHSNCRTFVPTDRQLSDDMIRAIVERDGVIGIVLYNKFLQHDYVIGDKHSVTLEAVVRHIEHICDLAGSTRHVGIGSDFDGGLGVECIPSELQSVIDLPRIGEALRAHGWSDADIDGVLCGNWARWLSTTLPDRPARS